MTSSPRSPRRGARWILYGLIAIGLCLGATAAAYRIPWVYDRTFWRVEILRGMIRDIVSPPDQTLPTPDSTLVAMVQATLTALPFPTRDLSPTDAPLLPSEASSPAPLQSPTANPSPSPTPVPLPPSIALTGVVHEWQKWNNCGPATLAMGLSYWDWQGDQLDTAAYLKPNPKDANVMPYEMEGFVNERAGLKAVTRLGGDLETLKRLIAAGFPVIVEKGFWVSAEKGWMGHYTLLTGYDDARGVFISQDSYEGPNHPRDYDQLYADWRAFDYLFITLYPPERESEVLSLLGPLADEFAAAQLAADRARSETADSAGEALAFSWFSLGTSLNLLGEYAGAAAAYDQARVAGLPWRMLWYQTGPYRAYINTGRNQDVIDLANVTLANMDLLEESYYWRGLAEQAQGKQEAAIADWKKSLEYHPEFGPSVYQLDLLGVAH